MKSPEIYRGKRFFLELHPVFLGRMEHFQLKSTAAGKCDCFRTPDFKRVYVIADFPDFWNQNPSTPLQKQQAI